MSHQRSRSVPVSGVSSPEESQERQDQFLSVHRRNTRTGVTPSVQRPELPNSSSGASRNDFSVSQHTGSTVVLPSANGTSTSVEASSGTPSPAGSSENNPWKRKTLLTLDGGGIRGYSSLLILQAVMTEIATIEREDPQISHSAHPLTLRPREPVRIQRSGTAASQTLSSTANTVNRPSPSSHYLPCHYFDYIAGTSTGGLIAIMLGRLSMTVDECLENYENLAGRVFGHPRIFHIRNCLWPKDKYDHKRLERVIEDIVKQREGNKTAHFPQNNEDMCRTMVLAWEKRHFMRERVPYIIRSYHHNKMLASYVNERNAGKWDNYPISQVGRATAAAPFYFKAVKLDKDDAAHELIDGGFGANNPSEEAYFEVRGMSNNDSRAVGLLLSLGTGRNVEDQDGSHQSSGWALYLSYINAAAKWATQSQATHVNMKRILNGETDYYRLNVRDGLGKMKLDEWKGDRGQKTLELIRARTRTYLETTGAVARVRAVARKLVEIRRARSSHLDQDRWERFCHGVEYACPIDSCDEARQRFRERRDLRRHIVSDHSSCNIDSWEDTLDAGKLFPLYSDVEGDSASSQGSSDS